MSLDAASGNTSSRYLHHDYLTNGSNWHRHMTLPSAQIAGGDMGQRHYEMQTRSESSEHFLEWIGTSCTYFSTSPQLCVASLAATADHCSRRARLSGLGCAAALELPPRSAQNGPTGAPPRRRAAGDGLDSRPIRERSKIVPGQ